jgi:hypothetical protein
MQVASCYYFYVGSFVLNTQEIVSGTVFVDSQTTFYVISQESLASWIAAGGCYPPNAEFGETVRASSAYSFTWTPQQKGTYCFLFISNDPLLNGSFEAQSQPNIITTSTLLYYSATKMTNVNYITRPFTYVTFLTGQPNIQLINGMGTLEIWFTLLAAIVVAIILAFLVKRRPMTRQTKEPKVTSQATTFWIAPGGVAMKAGQKGLDRVQENVDAESLRGGEPPTAKESGPIPSGTKSCRYCGAEILRESMFCEECGKNWRHRYGK